MQLAVLGSHPYLSLAELERTCTFTQRHNDATARFQGHPRHLGGSSKLAEIVDELPATEPEAIRRHVLEHIDNYLPDASAKLSVGISIYGRKWPGYKPFIFDIKKRLKQLGYRPRIVPGHGQEVSSAQVLHNRLERSQSELIISIGSSSTLVATTTWVQDINAYTRRDMDRPCRDMDTGMLPPKLAQIMLNLAGGSFIYDPFCGSGVILQEALLMGRRAAGSDLEAGMVACTSQNLQWLQAEFHTPPTENVFAADAREVELPAGIDAIVSESYLGPVLTAPPAAERIHRLAREADDLLRATLGNFEKQLPAGTTICLAAPAWKLDGQTVTPPLVDDLSSLAYNQIRLQGVEPHPLLYRRPDQYVGRRLILLEKS